MVEPTLQGKVEVIVLVPLYVVPQLEIVTLWPAAYAPGVDKIKVATLEDKAAATTGTESNHK